MVNGEFTSGFLVGCPAGGRSIVGGGKGNEVVFGQPGGGASIRLIGVVTGQFRVLAEGQIRNDRQSGQATSHCSSSGSTTGWSEGNDIIRKLIARTLIVRELAARQIIIRQIEQVIIAVNAIIYQVITSQQVVIGSVDGDRFISSYCCSQLFLSDGFIDVGSVGRYGRVALVCRHALGFGLVLLPDGGNRLIAHHGEGGDTGRRAILGRLVAHTTADESTGTSGTNPTGHQTGQGTVGDGYITGETGVGGQQASFFRLEGICVDGKRVSVSAVGERAGGAHTLQAERLFLAFLGGQYTQRIVEVGQPVEDKGEFLVDLVVRVDLHIHTVIVQRQQRRRPVAFRPCHGQVAGVVVENLHQTVIGGADHGIHIGGVHLQIGGFPRLVRLLVSLRVDLHHHRGSGIALYCHNPAVVLCKDQCGMAGELSGGGVFRLTQPTVGGGAMFPLGDGGVHALCVGPESQLIAPAGLLGRIG